MRKCHCSGCVAAGLYDSWEDEQDDNDPEMWLEGDGYGAFEDLGDDDFFDNDAEDFSGGNSVNGGVSMSSAQVGSQFKTGNSTVRGLNVGTVLQVVAPSTLEIVEVATPQAGDRIDTKYGPATVVRQSSRLDFELDENEVLYVADSDPVVRRLAI